VEYIRVLFERARARAGRSGRDVTVVPTIHPSAVLRADDRDAAYAGLVSDLRCAASVLRR
jgi:uracil-DNA glycosylase